jgi:hypothetical protein
MLHQLRMRARAAPLRSSACAAAAAAAAAASAATTAAAACEGRAGAAADHDDASAASSTRGRWAWQGGCSDRPLLLGFGNPTVDVTVTLSSAEMDAVGLRPGTEAAGESQSTKQRIVDVALAQPEELREVTPGGAALNSMRVAAWTGGTSLRVAFLGSVGMDEHADILTSAMASVGVEPLLLADPSLPTGLCASLVESKSKDRALSVVRLRVIYSKSNMLCLLRILDMTTQVTPLNDLCAFRHIILCIRGSLQVRGAAASMAPAFLEQPEVARVLQTARVRENGSFEQSIYKCGLFTKVCSGQT